MPYRRFTSSLLYIFTLLPLSLLCGCHVLDFLGDIQGKWQLTQIEVHEEGCDSIASPSDLYLNLMPTVAVAQISLLDEHRSIELHSLLSVDEDSIYFQFLPMDSDGETTRGLLTTRFLFPSEYQDIRLQISHLDKKKLVLSDNTHRWTLRKY